MKDDTAKLEARLRAASDRLAKLAATNAPYGAKVTAEHNYGAAYQQLVHAGLRPQLREKYRR